MKKKKKSIIAGDRILYACEKCGHIKKKTTKNYVYNAIFFIILFIGAGTIGTIIAMSIIGENINPINMIEAIRYHKAYEANNYVRNTMIPIVKNCTSNEDCIIIQTSEYLEEQISYLVSGFGKVYDPETTLKNKVGDCEEMSVLVVNSLRSFGIEARVTCNNKHNHCFATAHPEEKDYYFIIDLATIKGLHIARLGNDYKPWTFYEEVRANIK